MGGHKDVEPGVRNLVPQATGVELHLGVVQAVEELEVGGVGLEEQASVEGERRQHGVHRLYTQHQRRHPLMSAKRHRNLMALSWTHAHGMRAIDSTG